MKINLYNDDCFNVLKTLPDESVDLVLTDPPYGTTAIEWDSVLDFDKMWVELERIIKPKSNIILFASQPFSSLLITSKLDWFRYELIWNKNKCGSPGLAKKRPQKVHENILIFSKESGGIYNPIMEKGEPWKRESKNPEGYGTGVNTHKYGFGKNKFMGGENKGIRYPKSILHASRNFSAQQTVHPTQKPTNVLNWLIMTYSNEGDVVLDFTMGSGSTGVSAKLTGRKFIGIEKEKEYFDISEKRISFISDKAVEPLVTRSDSQLTTQIHKDMKTTPDKRHEK
jgi:site-specific DNA-methyltransferase (adenine-specific)|tara:strand:+ start:770 stop:1618 length:849 start_codon:yes stop_codon:yes gene_type:complete